MKRLEVVVVVVLAALAAGVACGGSDKPEVREPVVGDDGEPVERGPTAVPQAELDEVQRYLDRQR
ncbi:MAG TPA: hypothetical protein VML75_07225, partial [Kofleriaceae bacterium]|nr:hypothetical protein [Kofleriaceae bacterium]